jgi:hypothetical protein
MILAVLFTMASSSVPVVVRGNDFVHGQDLATVARFVGIDFEPARLEIPVLVARLLALLDICAALAEQLRRERRRMR